MGYTTNCEVCGKEYCNYHMTLYVLKNGVKTKVCSECSSKLLENEKYVYTNHVPTYCDGANSVSRCFDTEEELLQYIREIAGEKYIPCLGSGNSIVFVYKNEKEWRVPGFSTLGAGKLPKWEDVVKELYGEDPRRE